MIAGRRLPQFTMRPEQAILFEIRMFWISAERPEP